MRKSLLLTLFGLLLAGCDQLGIESPAQAAAAKEAEGRAIGSACRHSGRALEDCYTLNPKALKAAVFTGWRDMDAYMRENSLEVIVPVVPRPDPDAAKKKKAAAAAAAAAAENPDGHAKPEEAPVKKEEAPVKKDGAAHSATEPRLPAPVAGGKMV